MRRRGTGTYMVACSQRWAPVKARGEGGRWVLGGVTLTCAYTYVSLRLGKVLPLSLSLLLSWMCIKNACFSEPGEIS